MQSISISLIAFPNTIALLWGDSSTEQYQVRSSTRSARGAQRRGRKIRPVILFLTVSEDDVVLADKLCERS